MTERFARWTIPVVSTTVAIEVVPIFKLPAPATPVARRGDPVSSPSDPAVVSPAEHVPGSGAPRPIRRRILGAAAISLLVAVAVAGSIWLRQRAGPAPTDTPP